MGTDHRLQGALDSMPTSEELEQMKQNMYPCMACFCAEQSCTADISPICFAAGKVCCCVAGAGLEFPCIKCEPDPCYSEERGICEVNNKMCCMYSEVQFPPGKDIGFGCCGVGGIPRLEMAAAGHEIKQNEGLHTRRYSYL